MPKPSFTVAAICRTSTVIMALCVDLPNAMPSMLLSRVPRPTLSKWLWCASSNASRRKTSRANDHPGTRRTQLLCLSRRERESRANRSRGNAECLSTERTFGSRCWLGKQLARSSLKHSYHYIPVVPHETTGMLRPSLFMPTPMYIGIPLSRAIAMPTNANSTHISIFSNIMLA